MSFTPAISHVAVHRELLRTPLTNLIRFAALLTLNLENLTQTALLLFASELQLEFAVLGAMSTKILGAAQLAQYVVVLWIIPYA